MEILSPRLYIKHKVLEVGDTLEIHDIDVAENVLKNFQIVDLKVFVTDSNRELSAKTMWTASYYGKYLRSLEINT